MSYQVLARKWRPKRFADLVGQEHVVRALSNALGSERLHHAYLLTGTRGVGKTTIARILAKSLNCETGITAEPCGVCAACRQIDAGRYVDLLEIDAASNTGIDNIREVLENAQYAPTLGRFKVYIIDEVHMLSKSAFNAMLKTLEEPPAHVKFILATTDPQKVPVTVLSRCLQFSLRNMTPQQIAGYLAHVLEVEGVAYETPALSLLGRGASGSMRDALSLLDQAIAYGEGDVKEEGVRAMLGAVDCSYLFGLLRALADADGPLLIREAEQLAERGIGFDSALSEMAVLLQQISMAQIVPQAISPDEPEYDAIFALAGLMAPEDVQLYYQIAVHGRRDLALAPDEHAGFNMALIRMLAFHPLNQREPAPAAVRAQAPLAAHAAVAGREAMDQARAKLAQQVGGTRTPAATPRAQAAAALAGSNPAPAPVPAPEPEPEIEPEPAAALPLPAEAAPSIAAKGAEVADDDADGREGDVLPPDLPDYAMQDDDEIYISADELPQKPAAFDGNWLALVAEIGPRMGTVRMLAQNAVLKSWQGGALVLAVPESFRHLASRDYQDKLRTVLAEHFGHTLELSVTVEETGAETPAMRDARNRHELRQEARVVLENDPVVQQLVREFDATLLTDTIQPAQE
ncbi:DNA polymerase III subunit gamma/tau [Craterilacuibacter sinensis]|uniref:DNA polymerase III subunit gamma/tau n=1 Tax=Craterilacuibacter sinensis TaxID=2686017 RepID=A0A845BP37_9NEIS|nr:DNA polymerase III subunit gamma/tau [Craterilacuibacter sinensis]MXR37150.1 DNA polymerase III subunit gamma/tau [Craterilacuibacter sinensis]